MAALHSSSIARTIGFIAFALSLASGTAEAGKQCDKIVEDFVLMTTRISSNVSDPQERDHLQKEALRDLVRSARSVYGPFCPCEEFLAKAEALQKLREAWRSPPPGWEPHKSRADFLPLEVEIAHQDIRLLMQLMDVCKRY